VEVEEDPEILDPATGGIIGSYSPDTPVILSLAVRGFSTIR
jgi:hypothetical protein